MGVALPHWGIGRTPNTLPANSRKNQSRPPHEKRPNHPELPDSWGAFCVVRSRVDHGGVKMPDDSYARLIRMDRARLSAPGNARVTFLEGDARRWVKAPGTYGLAVAYTDQHVQVFFRSGPGTFVRQWFPAGVVRTVAEEDWHGLPFED